MTVISDPIDSGRPPQCVYMGGLAETLDGQTWLDTDCLEQVGHLGFHLENDGNTKP